MSWHLGGKTLAGGVCMGCNSFLQFSPVFCSLSILDATRPPRAGDKVHLRAGPVRP